MSAGDPSAVGWLARLRAGELSARELTARTLDRIDAADATVHAVVSQDRRTALEAADAADAARRAGDRRPLLGLPITVKDCLDVRGLPTLSGTLARRGHVADGDATVVARLRAAGAIPVAKTNVPELCSSFETDNVVHGRTDHPLDPARTPGGSSGGEAALLGADASIVGVGTDGGGSIRVPAHYVGVVGLRPTVGRTPETGAWPDTRAAGTADLTCLGPMARHVEDLALLLPIMSGADGIDPFAVDVALGDPDAVGLRGLRVGILIDHPDAPPVTPGVRAAVDAAARTLEGLGATVETLDVRTLVGDGPTATELFFAAAGADGGAGMRAATAGADG
ncbi:MAG: amidase, partial [Patulibacter sp.]